MVYIEILQAVNWRATATNFSKTQTIVTEMIVLLSSTKCYCGNCNKPKTFMNATSAKDVSEWTFRCLSKTYHTVHLSPNVLFACETILLITILHKKFLSNNLKFSYFLKMPFSESISPAQKASFLLLFYSTIGTVKHIKCTKLNMHYHAKIKTWRK